MPLTPNVSRLPKPYSVIKPHSRSVSSLPRPYRFHIGASYAGKPPDPQSRRLKTKSFAPDSEIGRWRDKTLAKYESAAADDHIGEDFFYVQDMRNQSGVALGLADGVGGWVDSGVDPSLFSQALMYHGHRYCKAAWAGEPETDPTQDYEEREQIEGWELSPRECLELAYRGVLRERGVPAGSSTACLLTLNASSGVLRSANLGDSGFSVIRSSSVIYQQRAQQHFFNCPKQLTKLPASTPVQSGSIIDSPDDADLSEMKLRDGDLVIAYTDGLSDNVFPTEIVSICSLVARQHALLAASPLYRHPGGSEPAAEQVLQDNAEDRLVQTIAERIVDYAQLCMSNKKRVSPFERAAAREGLHYRGGKVDDVTVLVALARETL
ncbi:protein serine/threonine phosphatase 2C [Amylocystis lapponica]|nr:protein serine/threonine phosphatase 2C [Amylocystis lapponica]